MNNQIVFIKVGRLLINVNHIVAVQEDVQMVGTNFSASCNIFTVDGKGYYYPGSKEEFLSELYKLLEEAGILYGK